MQNKALLMNQKDNVAVVLQATEKNDSVQIIDNQQNNQRIQAIESIDIYHKIAVKKILKGQEIIKYGEIIGKAEEDIPAGAHVHVHNIRSVKV
ncbi:MAG TPA: UxaA family hydrolase [Tetragenococcus sp.]|nr:UxaA family hydrolase [Tetragenococcus sp.]